MSRSFLAVRKFVRGDHVVVMDCVTQLEDYQEVVLVPTRVNTYTPSDRKEILGLS